MLQPATLGPAIFHSCGGAVYPVGRDRLPALPAAKTLQAGRARREKRRSLRRTAALQFQFECWMFNVQRFCLRTQQRYLPSSASSTAAILSM